MDVTSKEDIQQIVDKLSNCEGKLHILVNKSEIVFRCYLGLIADIATVQDKWDHAPLNSISPHPLRPRTQSSSGNISLRRNLSRSGLTCSP